MPAQVRVYAPGTVGNVGPGLDILGLAVAGAGDTVQATRTRQPGVVIADAGHWVQFEAPEAFNATLLELLAGVPS